MNTEQLTKLASFAGKSANDFWMATGKKPTDVIAELAAALIEANGKVQALAAENMGLKTFCKNAAFDADYEAEICMERGGFTDALNDIKTPATATATAVAQIEAQARIQGINFAASRLCAAYMAGFIDKPVSEVVDVVRMILSAKDEVANNPASEGLSGEYAEKILNEMDAFAAELREAK